MTKHDMTDLPQTEYIHDPDTGVLCHIIRRAVHEQYSRDDIVPANEVLQVGWVKCDAGQTFEPHWHKAISKDVRGYDKGECVVVVSGSVVAFYYGQKVYPHVPKFIKSAQLYPGDISVTLHGGHTYKVTEDATVLVEVKNGPYEGREYDKTVFEDDTEGRLSGVRDAETSRGEEVL